jgi:hypothetical protein
MTWCHGAWRRNDPSYRASIAEPVEVPEWPVLLWDMLLLGHAVMGHAFMGHVVMGHAVMGFMGHAFMGHTFMGHRIVRHTRRALGKSWNRECGGNQSGGSEGRIAFGHG